MTHSPELIEAVARAYGVAYQAFIVGCRTAVGPAQRLDAHMAGLRAALAAIDASGTHWVAPVKLTSEMIEAARNEPYVPKHWSEGLRNDWSAMRTAYLTKPEEDVP